MPTPTVNSQITDAVTQTNVKVLGESPAQATALAYQSYSNAVGLALENAMSTQGGMQQVANASTSSVCTMIIKAGASA
ncbi:MAG: RebB like protein [Alphaproteobacteria bacterium]|nr:MAG: RebB like protein [Alphaproteobacteria bacterium]